MFQVLPFKLVKFQSMILLKKNKICSLNGTVHSLHVLSFATWRQLPLLPACICFIEICPLIAHILPLLQEIETFDSIS